MVSISRKPRILFVTPFWPHLTGLGSGVRGRLILEALQAMGNVDVVVLDDTETGDVETHPSVLSVGKQTFLKVGPQPRKKLVGQLEWLLNPEISYPHGCGVAADSAVGFCDNLAAYDLVWFFKLRSPNMFPYASWPKSVLDIDDVH
jgi:hypothetical protein